MGRRVKHPWPALYWTGRLIMWVGTFILVAGTTAVLLFVHFPDDTPVRLKVAAGLCGLIFIGVYVWGIWLVGNVVLAFNRLVENSETTRRAAERTATAIESIAKRSNART